MSGGGISIVVPLAATETAWRRLLPLLPAKAELGDEILLAAPPAGMAGRKEGEALPPPARLLRCGKGGRAAQMNAAARAAKNDSLWFVHADSRPPPPALELLRAAMAGEPAALHYFDLRFYDGGAKMRINEWGVRLRCALFGNPFGDQALAMRRALFESLGGYDEQATMGEDNLLALAARRQGAPLCRVAAAMQTSARRYNDEGWLRVMLLFQGVWIRQWLQGKKRR